MSATKLIPRKQFGSCCGSRVGYLRGSQTRYDSSLLSEVVHTDKAVSRNSMYINTHYICTYVCVLAGGTTLTAQTLMEPQHTQ